MLVYPKYGLKTGVNVLEFRVLYFVKAGSYLVQPCWFIRTYLWKRKMFRKIIVAYFVLFTFSAQIVFSGVPVYSADIASKGSAGEAARHGLQNPVVDGEAGKQLWTQYLYHIQSLIPLQRKLRGLSVEVLFLARKSRDIELLKKSGAVGSELIDAMEQRLAYLRDKVPPAQENFYRQEEGLEKDLESRAAQTDLAGSLKLAPLLAMTYYMNKELLEMEHAYLERDIITLEIFFARDPDVDESIAASLKTSLKKYRELSARIKDGLKEVEGLQNQFAKTWKKFNKEKVERTQARLEELDEVIAAFKGSIKMLRNERDENVVKHADLLTPVVEMLVEKKKVLDERLLHFSSDYEDIGGNFIYVPAGLESDKTRPLVARLEAINGSLIKQTISRKKDAEKLAEGLGQLYKDTLAEQKEMKDLFGRLPENFSEVVKDVDQNFAAFIADLVELQNDIARVNTQFSELGTENSAEIIHDYDRSYKVVRINQGLEKVVSRFKGFFETGDLIIWQLGVIFLKVVFTGVDDGSVTVEQLKSLFVASDKRVDTFNKIFVFSENISDSLQADFELIKPLNPLTLDIFKQYQQESAALLPIMKTALQANIANKRSEYYGYLDAVYSEMKNRVAVSVARVKRKQIQIKKLANEQRDNVLGDQSFLWQNSAHFHQSYSEILQQIADLASVDAIFSQKEFVPAKRYNQIRNLFTVSRRLRIPVGVSIRDGNASIEFSLRGKVLKVDGLGTSSLDLTAETALPFPFDYLFRVFTSGMSKTVGKKQDKFRPGYWIENLLPR